MELIPVPGINSSSVQKSIFAGIGIINFRKMMKIRFRNRFQCGIITPLFGNALFEKRIFAELIPWIKALEAGRDRQTGRGADPQYGRDYGYGGEVVPPPNVGFHDAGGVVADTGHGDE